jgi:predicted transcriptional regulator
METNAVEGKVAIQVQAKAEAKAEIRLSLIVSTELNETLQALADSQHSSKSEVLRKAIALYNVAAEAKQKDQRIGILDKDRNVVTEIVGI